MKPLFKVCTLLLLLVLPTQAFCETKANNKQKNTESKKVAEAPLIEIKGITIGMPMQDYKAIIATNGDAFFSIGGVTGKSPMPPMFEHREGKLDSFVFFFEPQEFSRVLEAVKSKYPSMGCKNSEVQNRMGASFPQVECVLAGTNSTLRVSKYAGDITTSMLSLTSKERLKEYEDKLKKGNSDI